MSDRGLSRFFARVREGMLSPRIFSIRSEQRGCRDAIPALLSKRSAQARGTRRVRSSPEGTEALA